MEKLKLFLDNKKRFASISSADIMYADDSEEFYYKDSNEVVPKGEPIGIDVPIYEFQHLQYTDKINASDNSRDAEKWRYNASQEFECLLEGHLPVKEVKLTLFNNVYWKKSEEN
tara:strand:- start:3302 stop:3643 length:342 start_codon:yes stop_codon:yes gene_type:complete